MWLDDVYTWSPIQPCIECLRFLSGPGWDNMGQIKYVSADGTRGYPYLVCKNISIFHGVWCIEKFVTRVTDRHHISCHEGHWSASRGLPRDAEQWSRVTDFFYPHHTPMIDTFWFTTFDFQSWTCYKVTFFPLKGVFSSLNKPTLPATAVRFLTLTSYLHSDVIFDVIGCKNQRHLST